MILAVNGRRGEPLTNPIDWSIIEVLVITLQYSHCAVNNIHVVISFRQSMGLYHRYEHTRTFHDYLTNSFWILAVLALYVERFAISNEGTQLGEEIFRAES